MNFNDYYNKIRGKGISSYTNIDLYDVFWSFVGGLLGIGSLAWLEALFFTGSDLLLVIAPFGASSVLVYGAIQSPLAQPRNLIGGHIVSAIAGVACYKLFYTIPLLAGAIAVASAIAAMQITRTVHPPGGATALLAVVGSQQIHKLSWLYVLIPVALGASILLIVAILINSIPQHRRYPINWL
jgi:CBS-domain-containing membrane protein